MSTFDEIIETNLSRINEITKFFLKCGWFPVSRSLNPMDYTLELFFVPENKHHVLSNSMAELFTEKMAKPNEQFGIYYQSRSLSVKIYL